MDVGRKSSNRKNKLLKLILSFLNSVWKRKIRLLLLMVAIFGMLVSWSVRGFDQTATGEIILSYGNAFKGLNPNGTRFNIYDFTSDEIIEAFLKKTGLGKVMTADELVNCISIEPSITQSISKRYISNVYNVTLKLPGNMRYRLSADNALSMLMDVYHKNFNEKYALNRSVLNMDWSYTQDMEYLEFYNLVSMRIQNITKFLEELAAASSSSSYKLKKESFKALMESVENFKEVYLENFAAYIKVQRVFRNADTYADKLNYKCLILDKDYKVANRLHSVYKDVLSSYDESVIAFVMVPMYDNKDGLYMARTSIGTDSLAMQSSNYNATSKALSEEIALSKDTMHDAEYSVFSESSAAVADSKMREIMLQMDALIKRINISVDEYQRYSTESNIQCRIKYISMSTLLEFKKNIIITVLLIFAVCVAFAVIDKRRSAIESK